MRKPAATDAVPAPGSAAFDHGQGTPVSKNPAASGTIEPLVATQSPSIPVTMTTVLLP